MSDDLPDYVLRNRVLWDLQAPNYAVSGEREWAAAEPIWGIFGVPESELHLLPDDLTGLETIELGRGTADVSSWHAKRGANPAGIDISPKQLETATRLQVKHGIEFPLYLGNAEQTPFADASFDFAISEYGASIWRDPYKWIPEAARLLRPGDRLVFLVNSLLLMLCTGENDDDAPVTTKLERDYFGMHRFDWSDGAAEFHLNHGDMNRLLRANEFEIENLVEIQVPADAATSYPFVATEWAHRRPREEVWKARKHS